MPKEDKRSYRSNGRSKSNGTARDRRTLARRATEAAELLKSIPEPAAPPDFLHLLKEMATAFRASSNPEGLAAELTGKLLKNEFMKVVLKDALTRFILLRSADPGFAERTERWKRDGMDSEGYKEFLNYLTARSDRAEELFRASMAEKKVE